MSSVFLLSLFLVLHLSWDVPADAGFLYGKGALFGVAIKKRKTQQCVITTAMFCTTICFHIIDVFRHLLK
jgi:hypothetical protein